MSDSSFPVIYQLKVVLLGISLMIWRHLLVSSDCTIADLHYMLQIAMGWEDIHLHHFIIYGKQHGERFFREDGQMASQLAPLNKPFPFLLKHCRERPF